MSAGDISAINIKSVKKTEGGRREEQLMFHHQILHHRIHHQKVKRRKSKMGPSKNTLEKMVKVIMFSQKVMTKTNKRTLQ